MRSQRRQSAPEGSAGGRFPRRYRLRKRKEYLRIQRSYRGRKSPHFTLIEAPGATEETRLGVTVSRKVGSAVRRNHVKRRVREFFRLHRIELQPATDFVVIAKPGAGNLSFEDVESELAQALRIGR